MNKDKLSQAIKYLTKGKEVEEIKVDIARLQHRLIASEKELEEVTIKLNKAIGNNEVHFNIDNTIYKADKFLDHIRFTIIEIKKENSTS